MKFLSIFKNSPFSINLFSVCEIYLYNKALRSYIYVSYRWPNGWTELAENF